MVGLVRAQDSSHWQRDMVLGPPSTTPRQPRQPTAQEIREDQANSIDDQGRACMDRGDYDAALAYFQQAYDLSQEERHAKYYRADIARVKGLIARQKGLRAAAAGDYQAALHAFEEAASHQPDFKGYRKNIAWAKGAIELELGNAAYRSGNLVVALAHYKQAEQLSPDDFYRKQIIDVGRELKNETIRKKQDQVVAVNIQHSIRDFANGLGAKDPQTPRIPLEFEDLGAGQIGGAAEGNNPRLDLLPRSTPETNKPVTGLKSHDPMVVDAGHVPSGLPKIVEEAIPPTPTGDRVRKGLEAIQAGDWKVALAWFQDALNKEPGDAGLGRLVDLAQFTLEKQARPPAPAVDLPPEQPNPLAGQSPAVTPHGEAAPDSPERVAPQGYAPLAHIAAIEIAARARVDAVVKAGGDLGGGPFAHAKAVEKAARGEGYTKEELDAQVQQALSEYLKNNANRTERDVDPTPTPAVAEEITIGGKG